MPTLPLRNWIIGALEYRSDGFRGMRKRLFPLSILHYSSIPPLHVGCKYNVILKDLHLLNLRNSKMLIEGGIAKRLRQRSAKPLFTGSTPVAASNNFEGLSGSDNPLFIFGCV